MTTTTTRYIEKLTASLIAWRDLRTREKFDDLARVLGYGGDNMAADRTEKCEIIEAVICRTWTVLLREQLTNGRPPGFVTWYVMDGLLDNDRWKTLLGNESDAHAFAAFIVRFLSVSGVGGARSAMPAVDDLDMNNAIKKKFKLSLAEWLAPLDLSGLFTMSDLARALFGDAWCVTVLDTHPRPVLPDLLIMSNRPPFLPGLAGFDGPLELALPALD